MSVDSKTVVNQPAYKQGWPWFLFGLPAISVVVCTTLYIIANSYHVNSIVAGDYAKNGKAVEMLIGRQKHAQSLGLSAQATVRVDAISVKLSATQEKDLPAELRLAVIHPTQERFDQHVLLQREQSGVYSGALEKPLHVSRWEFQLEDESRVWRMLGYVYVSSDNISTETEVSIMPFQSNHID